MHFERNYQELWRNRVETKRPNDGIVYDEFLFIREKMKLVTNKTVRLRNKTSFLFYLFIYFRFFFNELSRSRLYQINRFRKPCRKWHFISRREHDFLALVFNGADQKFQT